MYETEDRLCFRNTGELFIFKSFHPEFHNRIIFQNNRKNIPPFIFKSLAAEKKFTEECQQDDAFTWEECHKALCDKIDVPTSEPTDHVPEFHIIDDASMKHLWPIAEEYNAKFAEQLTTDPTYYNPGMDLRNVGRGDDGTSVRPITRPNNMGQYEPDTPSVFVTLIEKTCKSDKYARLEEKILRGLRDRGLNVVKVYKRKGKILEMSSVGMTVFDYANRILPKKERDQKKVDACINEAIEQKARIYDAIDDILTAEEKDFVIGAKIKKLVESFPDAHPIETVPFMYAYKLMKSMGIDDVDFRDRFTNIFGYYLLMAEMKIPGFARFLSDEYTKNRGIETKEGEGLTQAFDFTPKHGLVQEDDFFAICSMGNGYDLGQEWDLVNKSMQAQGIPEELSGDYLVTFICMAPYRSYLQIGHLIKEQANILGEWHFQIPHEKDRVKFQEKAREMVDRKWRFAHEELKHYLMKARQYVELHVMKSPVAEGKEDEAIALHNEIIDVYKQRFLEAMEPMKESLKERDIYDDMMRYANFWFTRAKFIKFADTAGVKEQSQEAAPEYRKSASQ
ncbi:hypothetical protein KY336_01505 [Candidatus Woesearchaeota archaeon]|nr:hypothetical protein [Candidatus Woesearchaeota archaeon]